MPRSSGQAGGGRIGFVGLLPRNVGTGRRIWPRDPTIDPHLLLAVESETMSQNDDWSPDEPLGTEAFEQGDEALDEDSRIDPGLIEDVEGDPSLGRALRMDERELEETGAELDDPEALVTLEGGMDDPDGLGEPSSRARSRREDNEGWDLDAPVTTGGEADTDSTE